MRFDDVIQHYGTQAEAARQLGVTRAAVWQWRLEGIPLLRQYQIERLTDGALTACASTAPGASGEAA